MTLTNLTVGHWQTLIGTPLEVMSGLDSEPGTRPTVIAMSSSKLSGVDILTLLVWREHP